MAIRCRDVDRLAASRLLVRLNLASSPEVIEIVGQEFAAHRETTATGLVARVHQRIVDVLERCSIELLSSRSTSGEWAEGFACAEQAIAELEPEELLDEAPDMQLSKGQMLRYLIRSARKSDSARD